ncbi:MAG: DNA replication complex subunit Gins51 [Candidatus Thorarchaeota archaeon]
MNEQGYNEIKQAWEDECETESLVDLEDLKLSRMSSYISHIRLQLASTPSDQKLQADIFSHEALNAEFMLRDLLTLRRGKILATALEQKTPEGIMTLSEEELFNRLTRSFEAHSKFVEDVLTGTPEPTMKRVNDVEKIDADKLAKKPSKSTELNYVMVRFLRPIEDQFMGFDEKTYGPFQKEDVATIPAENAKIWLSDGTVARIVPSMEERN